MVPVHALGATGASTDGSREILACRPPAPRTERVGSVFPRPDRPPSGRGQGLLQSVYDQADTDAVHALFDRVIDSLADNLPAVAAHLETAGCDLPAFTAFPKEMWPQMRSNNPSREAELRDPSAH